MSSLLLLIVALAANSAELVRLDQDRLPAVELKVLRRAPLCVDAGGQGMVAYVSPGQAVTLLALGEHAYFVSARTATDTARGWIAAAAVEAPPLDVVGVARRQQERDAANRELIARHEVAAGMTREQVLASKGKPEQRKRVRVGDTVEELWFYEAFRYVPLYKQAADLNGQLRQQVSYQRLAVGHTVVVFREGEVVTVDEQPTGLPR